MRHPFALTTDAAIIVIADFFFLNVGGMAVFKLRHSHTTIAMALNLSPMPLSVYDVLTLSTHCHSFFLPVFQYFREGV